MTDKWVAITGGNGYIGGQTALRFKDLGYKKEEVRKQQEHHRDRLDVAC